MMNTTEAVAPTHYCVVCAAKWRKWPDGTWSVLTDCGPCCDNVPMDKAPVIAFQPDGSLLIKDHDREKRKHQQAERRAMNDRYRGIICAVCDEPFEQHYDNWRCSRRVAPRFKFPPNPTDAAIAAYEAHRGLTPLERELLEALEAIRCRGIERDIKWTGMTASDIANAAIAKAKAMKEQDQ